MRHLKESSRKINLSMLKKVLSVIGFVVLIIVLAYNLTLIAQTIVRPDKTPSFMGIKTYVIVSGSMEPELNIGDIVIVKEVAAAELKTNDIISYRGSASVITHRIIAINTDTDKPLYKTRGDNNNIEDEGFVSIEAIEGKVINKIPKVGNIALLLQNKISLIIISVLFFIIIFTGKKPNKKSTEQEV